MELEEKVGYMLIDAGYNGDGFHGTHSANDLTRYISHDETPKRWLEEINRMGYEVPSDRWKHISLTLTELLINARSSCEESNESEINYQVYTGDDGIVIRVNDEGPGFDHKKEIKKTQQMLPYIEEDALLNLQKDHPGRAGTYCLLAYADDFAFNEKGNNVAALFLYDSLNQ